MGNVISERVAPRTWPARLPALLILSAVGIYALAFRWLYPAQGLGAMALACLPIAIAAWYAGARGGLIGGLLIFPLNILLLTLLQAPGWELMSGEGAIGSFALPILGILVGWLQDSSVRAKLELSERRYAERRRASELSTLLKASKVISSSLELEEVLKIIAEQIVRVTDVDGCALSRWDYESDEVVTWVEWRADGLPLSDTPGTRYALEAYPTTRKVLQERRPALIQVSDPTADPAELALMRRNEVSSLLMLPLAVGKRVTGLIELDASGQEREFSPEDLRLCEALADQAAIAIEHAQLYEQAQKEIMERRRAEQQLLHDAFHDALTDLPNRALFRDRLGLSMRRARRHSNYLFAVLFLDIDRFKNVNDSLGHQAGDELLIAIARRLERCLRPGDSVARLGGDEFAILLDAIRTASDATRVAERIKGELESPFRLDKHRLYITTSIGIAINSGTYKHADEILRDADIAMYKAKSLGKARHEVFDSEMHAQVVSRLQWEIDLRLAIERQELLIHYQPVIDLEREAISGFEALIRWQHPERGMVFPADFIHLAEDTGLIIAIDRWVLREACRQIQAWQEELSPERQLTVHINLSGLQFSQPDLIDHVAEVLSETGVSPSSVRLEITESALMDCSDAAVTQLAKLRELGIQLHIDDFGTGYSSLSYLHRFAIDTLKIPRSFVGRLERQGEGEEIVRTILTLASNLNMGVIAEGVETLEELERLQNLGCKEAQGYFFSRPLEPAQVPSLFAQARPWLVNAHAPEKPSKVA